MFANDRAARSESGLSPRRKKKEGDDVSEPTMMHKVQSEKHRTGGGRVKYSGHH